MSDDEFDYDAYAAEIDASEAAAAPISDLYVQESTDLPSPKRMGFCCVRNAPTWLIFPSICLFVQVPQDRRVPAQYTRSIA